MGSLPAGITVSRYHCHFASLPLGIEAGWDLYRLTSAGRWHHSLPASKCEVGLSLAKDRLSELLFDRQTKAASVSHPIALLGGMRDRRMRVLRGWEETWRPAEYLPTQKVENAAILADSRSEIASIPADAKSRKCRGARENPPQGKVIKSAASRASGQLPPHRSMSSGSVMRDGRSQAV